VPPPKKKAAGKVGKPPLAPKASSDKTGAEPADGPSAERLALGARLRRFRRDLGWTLEEASRVTGVGRSTLSKIENGQISPTFDLLRRLTMRMRVDLVVLFSAETNQEPRGRRSLTLMGNC
jgi:DNA-binding XRE family transcriptional regulator